MCKEVLLSVHYHSLDFDRCASMIGGDCSEELEVPLHILAVDTRSLGVQWKLLHSGHHNLSFHYSADTFFSAGQIPLHVAVPGQSEWAFHLVAMIMCDSQKIRLLKPMRKIILTTLCYGLHICVKILWMVISSQTCSRFPLMWWSNETLNWNLIKVTKSWILSK